MIDLRIAPDAAGAAEEAAVWVAAQLRNAVRRRGAATIAFSGGSTPAAMVAALVQLDVPWAGVQVWQVDERVAPDHDPARNAGLLRDLPLPPRHVHLMPVTAARLGAAAARYACGLPPRFDVVHLGLGDDGHTASWPPGDPVVDSALDVAISGEYRGHVRMTLTPRVVNLARHRLLLVCGAGKARPLHQWLLHDPSLPADRVRRTSTVVVADAAAAAALPPPAE